MKKCNVEGCENTFKITKGYCNAHYQKWKTYGDPLVGTQRVKKLNTICSVDGCNKKEVSKSYCMSHYSRFYRYGNPLKGSFYRNHNHDGMCSIEGCNKKHKAKGFCVKHLERFIKHGDPTVTKLNREHNGKCSVDECEGKYHSQGLCLEHFYKSDFKKENNHKRRALKTNAPINDLTVEDWCSSLKYFKSECAYCGSNENLQQEHIIPLSKRGSNTITNIIPACETCNKSKKNNSLEKWYPKQTFYLKERELKIYTWMGCETSKQDIQFKLF